MSAAQLARCLGELQQLLPTVEDLSLRNEIAEQVEWIMHKMHQHCLAIAKQKLGVDLHRKHAKSNANGPNLADAAVRETK